MQSVTGLVWIESSKKSRSASFYAPTAMLFDTTICEITSEPVQGSLRSSRNSTPSWPLVKKRKRSTTCSLARAMTSSRKPSSITSTNCPGSDRLQAGRGARAEFLKSQRNPVLVERPVHLNDILVQGHKRNSLQPGGIVFHQCPGN